MRRGLTAAFVAAFVLAAPAQAAPTSVGWLDPTFSGDGLVVVPSVTSGRDSEILPDAAVIQTATGRIYVFSARYPKDKPGWNGHPLAWLELTAFKNNGALDPAFHGGRPAVAVRGQPGFGAIQGPFVPRSGRPTVAFNDRSSTLVERWTANGNTDATFSGDGRASAADNGSVTVLPGGSTRAVGPSFPEPVLMLVGLTTTGAPDTRVGPGGSRMVVNSTVLRWWITSDATGRLTIASLNEGLAEDHLLVRRLSSAGTPITTWGTNGVTELAFQPVPTAALTLTVGPDGSTYIGTSTNVSGRTRVTIEKLDPSGQPDAAFGTDGVLVLPTAATSRLQDMIVLGSRLILSYVAGSGSTRQPALARLDATDGSLDPTFGHGGIVPTASLATGLAAAGPGSSDFLTVSRSGGTSNATIVLARRNG